MKKAKLFHVSDEEFGVPPLEPKQMLKIFASKSAEFLDGLLVETGVALDSTTLNRLKLALLEDFIEVHNDALKHAMVLPEDKAGVNKLLKS